MHHPTDRIAHTTAFVTPVVEHWLEREIAQWVHPMKDRSDDPSHHERTLLPRSYISLLRAYDAILTDIYDFCRFTLKSFHSLYSNCCEFAVTPSMLHEAKHATAAYNREHGNKLSVSQVVLCLLLYMGVLQRDPMPKLCFVMVLTSYDFFQIVRIFCHDLTVVPG